MQTLNRVLGKVAKALETVMIASLMVMVVVMFMQVVLRYVFHTSILQLRELFPEETDYLITRYEKRIYSCRDV